jgi:hypothetical protein
MIPYDSKVDQSFNTHTTFQPNAQLRDNPQLVLQPAVLSCACG